MSDEQMKQEGKDMPEQESAQEKPQHKQRETDFSPFLSGAKNIYSSEKSKSIEDNSYLRLLSALINYGLDELSHAQKKSESSVSPQAGSQGEEKLKH